MSVAAPTAVRRWKVAFDGKTVRGERLKRRTHEVAGQTPNAAKMNCARRVLDEAGWGRDFPAAWLVDRCRVLTDGY